MFTTGEVFGESYNVTWWTVLDCPGTAEGGGRGGCLPAVKLRALAAAAALRRALALPHGEKG